jgi:hypothetical protein
MKEPSKTMTTHLDVNEERATGFILQNHINNTFVKVYESDSKTNTRMLLYRESRQ